MKKKIIILMFFAVLIMSLTACVSKGSKGYESNTGLVAIPGANDLYYDSQTKLYTLCSTNPWGTQGMGICLPTMLRTAYHTSTTRLSRNWSKSVMYKPPNSKKTSSQFSFI